MRKILVVEDEQILRETYETILSTQPYLYDVAQDGSEALEKCRQHRYDLILLDLMMPVMNGAEFLEAYAKMEGKKSKIIILSNLSTGKELDKAHELGVMRNLVKAELSPKQLL